MLIFYFLVSLVTFAAYGMDKRRALSHHRRISERTLHLLELAGGFPGAFLAQRVFHHKRRKTRYMLIFWLIVAGHVIFWTVWLLRSPSAQPVFH